MLTFGLWKTRDNGWQTNMAEIRIWKPLNSLNINSVVLGRNHGALMIAEESTAWPRVTDKPENDGLGFNS